jgi:hypothetical protein
MTEAIPDPDRKTMMTGCDPSLTQRINHEHSV